ncbi:Arsenical resistance operon trans-acting repressor ArsD [invertebrate metagenome]|uniref:Arsenical resistance operon trans-acting repressor ArsD n=1 Tax=invertebrate metagenome TaxID=1711999 RepID=A0A2H9T5F1_9ZZZZ
MKAVKIYDPSMCCSSGVCGTDLDQSLVNFSADFTFLKENGADIKRFNLAQEPMAFVENQAVAAFLEAVGEKGLPVTIVDGNIVLTHRYPSREELKSWASIELNEGTKKPMRCCSSSCSC